MKLFFLLVLSSIIANSYSQSYNKVIPDSTLWQENKYDTLMLDSLVICANEVQKPLLLYFYSNRNVNSFRFNEAVLEDDQVRGIISKNFLPILCDIDSREPIPEIRNPEIDGVRYIITFGKRNNELEEKLIGKKGIAPMFIIVNLDGQVISNKGWIGREPRLKEEFKSFLSSGLRTVGNSNSK